jgi:hypothetical protein
VLLELIVEPLKALFHVTPAFSLELKLIALGRSESEANDTFEWLSPPSEKSFEFKPLISLRLANFAFTFIGRDIELLAARTSLALSRGRKVMDKPQESLA